MKQVYGEETEDIEDKPFFLDHVGLGAYTRHAVAGEPVQSTLETRIKPDTIERHRPQSVHNHHAKPHRAVESESCNFGEDRASSNLCSNRINDNFTRISYYKATLIQSSISISAQNCRLLYWLHMLRWKT